MHPALKQILVHVDASSLSEIRLAAARRLAEQHGAALAALYAVIPSIVSTPQALPAGDMLYAGLLALDEERRKSARAAFDKILKSPGAPASWGELDSFSPLDDFSRQALYADLLVMGQADPATADSTGVASDFVESVLVASRKPALMIPWTGVQRTFGEIVAVAWKETPESARALSAAMPLLQRARQVHVLSWGPVAPHTAGGLLNLETYFRAHQLEPVWHHRGEETGELGDRLLSMSFELDADLLVMGCYGHSRAREWVLGGATRTVLRSMTLPVLMAH